MPAYSAIAFDAYGTLFDVHSVIATCEQLWPNQGAAVSQLWRTKQLEYSWLRTLMGRYIPFDQVTDDALSYACAALALPLSRAAVRQLQQAYLELTPFAEVAAALDALAPRRMIILSNGSPAMLDPLLASSGLSRRIEAALSVDQVKQFKPLASVYELAVTHFNVPRAEILFVSSNGWDAAGARAFGFPVAWVNRAGAPMECLGEKPDFIIKSLVELPTILLAIVARPAAS